MKNTFIHILVNSHYHNKSQQDQKGWFQSSTENLLKLFEVIIFLKAREHLILLITGFFCFFFLIRCTVKNILKLHAMTAIFKRIWKLTKSLSTMVLAAKIFLRGRSSTFQYLAWVKKPPTDLPFVTWGNLYYPPKPLFPLECSMCHFYADLLKYSYRKTEDYCTDR